jgi:hypothetical protein
MTPLVKYHTADDASDAHEATLARRGPVAGKLIGEVWITDEVAHSFVVPDELVGDDEAVHAFGVDDFYTTTVPLCEPAVLEEKRAQVRGE